MCSDNHGIPHHPRDLSIVIDDNVVVYVPFGYAYVADALSLFPFTPLMKLRKLMCT